MAVHLFAPCHSENEQDFITNNERGQRNDEENDDDNSSTEDVGLSNANQAAEENVDEAVSNRSSNVAKLAASKVDRDFLKELKRKVVVSPIKQETEGEGESEVVTEAQVSILCFFSLTLFIFIFIV